MENLLKEKSDKNLEAMYVELYNSHFSGHDLFGFNPNKNKVYVVKVEEKKKRTLWNGHDLGGCYALFVNNRLTDEEIRKCMVIHLAGKVTCTTRKNDWQKTEEIARVAAEMGTTTEDIMSVYNIDLKELYNRK